MAITYPSFTPPKPKVKKPADVFGTPDPTKQLGRDAKSGVESQIADISKSVGNVNQRLADERAARERGITRQAEEQRQKMARMFGIDSGGLKGGRAIRVAGTIGAQEMQGKEQLAGEFGQRVPQEQAQSLQLLQGLQRGQEQADINAATAASQIDLSERAQSFNEYATQRQMTDAEYNSEVNRRVQSGELDIADRDQLLRQRAQDEAEKLGDVQRQTALRSMSDQEANSAMSRAEVAGNQTGIFTDPQTGQTRETLQAELGRRQASVAERGMSVQEASLSEDTRLREFALNLQDRIQSGQLTNEQAQTQLQARQVRVQEIQSQHQILVDNARLELEQAQSDSALASAAVDRARAEGEATGNYVDPQTGESIETLQARAQEFQQELQDKQFNQQVANDARNFSLGNREIDARYEEIKLRGNISANELAQRENEFVRSRETQISQFTESMNLSRDEFDELKRRSQAGELDTTRRTDLAYKQFEDMQTARDKEFEDEVKFRDAEAAFEKEVQRAFINGEFEGKTTTQEAQRLWSNASEEAKLYGDDPPKILTLEGIKRAMQGEYDATYDFDKNGVVNQIDFGTMAAMGQDLGGGNYLVTPMGRTTLAAKQMLINSSQFKDELNVRLQGVTNDEERVKIEQQLANDRMTQFRDEIDLRRDDLQRMKNEFMTSQTGIVSRVNENGNLEPQYVRGPATQNPDGTWTPGPWQPATTMSKQNHEQATQRFNRDFNITAAQIATRIGALPADDNLAISRFWDEVGDDFTIGSVDVRGYIADTLGLSNAFSINSNTAPDYFRQIASTQLANEGIATTPEAVRKRQAEIARQMLIGSLNEQTMGAISGTMAQVVFQGQYAPQAPPPSQAAQIFGGIAGSIAGGLASKSDINSKTDIFPLSVTSDIAVKDDITNIATGDDLMERLDAMPVSTWRYKDEPPNIRHLGPMAQHFKKAFNLGNSDKKIDVVDGMGVALTASKHLNGKVKALNERLKKLERLARGKR